MHIKKIIFPILFCVLCTSANAQEGWSVMLSAGELKYKGNSEIYDNDDLYGNPGVFAAGNVIDWYDGNITCHTVDSMRVHARIGQGQPYTLGELAWRNNIYFDLDRIEGEWVVGDYTSISMSTSFRDVAGEDIRKDFSTHDERSEDLKITLDHASCVDDGTIRIEISFEGTLYLSTYRSDVISDPEDAIYSSGVFKGDFFLWEQPIYD